MKSDRACYDRGRSVHKWSGGLALFEIKAAYGDWLAHHRDGYVVQVRYTFSPNLRGPAPSNVSSRVQAPGRGVSQGGRNHSPERNLLLTPWKPTLIEPRNQRAFRNLTLVQRQTSLR